MGDEDHGTRPGQFALAPEPGDRGLSLMLASVWAIVVGAVSLGTLGLLLYGVTASLNGHSETQRLVRILLIHFGIIDQGA